MSSLLIDILQLALEFVGKLVIAKQWIWLINGFSYFGVFSNMIFMFINVIYLQIR